ncbi:hypothetical protein HDV02_005751 [Globomyces sp. JEL0801]|nr:hypothetical protein HDV02_005751 [Globomyces sp. JEL0801]
MSLSHSPESIHNIHSENNNLVQSFFTNDPLHSLFSDMEIESNTLFKPFADYPTMGQYCDAIDQQLRITSAINTSLDPYFSNLSDLGDVCPKFIVDTMPLHSNKLQALCYQLHEWLLECLTYFTSGSEDDGYKLLCNIFILLSVDHVYKYGKRFNVFRNVQFAFPSNYPTNDIRVEEELPRIDEADQFLVDCLWCVCLKVDTYSAMAYNRTFIITELQHSHINLPVDASVFPFIPYHHRVLMGLPEFPTPKEFFIHHLTGLRIFRRIIHFGRLTVHNYSPQDLRNIAEHLHGLTMNALLFFPPQLLAFRSLEQFIDISTLPKPNLSLDLTLDVLNIKFFLYMMTKVHSTALRFSIYGKYNLSTDTQAQPSYYHSHEIILLSTRAFGYLLARPNNCTSMHGGGLPFFNLEAKPKLMNAFQSSASASLHYQISESILKGFTTLPMNEDYLQEAVLTIKNIVYPNMAEDGWNWPIASFFASKLQTVIRLYIE